LNIWLYIKIPIVLNQIVVTEYRKKN